VVLNRLRSKNWKTSWLGVITALLFLLFFVGGPDDDASRSFKNFWNVGHFAFFALFIRLLVVDGPLGAGTTFYKQLVLSVLLATLLGVAIELVQSGVGRVMDLHDVGRDILGALIGLFFSPSSLSRLASMSIRVGLVFLLVLQVIPWALDLADEIHASQQFPLLSDFESDSEITRSTPDWTSSIATPNNVARSTERTSCL